MSLPVTAQVTASIHNPIFERELPLHRATPNFSYKTVSIPFALQSLTSRPSSARPHEACRSRILNVRLHMASDPGEYRHHFPRRDTGCPGESKPSALTHQNFRGSTPSDRLNPLPFAPQGSILGSCLATPQVRFLPTRLRDIAKPHWQLFLPWGRGDCNIGIAICLMMRDETEKVSSV